eukprot:Tamp_01626.p1 GENE.Tamp_01626~~Tamp_01626.p1  ORF type:complete len:842 (-),score=141.30 Tamp_01626:2391-4916(-)
MFRGHVLNAAMPGRPSPNFSFSSTSEQAAPLRVDGGLPASRAQPVRHATKEEPGVFAGFVGDGVDKNKQFPQGRYLITKKLGSGTYGKVLGCTDKKYNLPVAIKIVRKDPPIYKEAAKKEIAVLRHLGGTHGCLRLLRDFEHDGHLCISMEMYGENLQAFMKRKGKAFELPAVADIGLQLVHACEYMHSKQIIHTDIKCENILLAAGPEGSFTIKLVDMGSSLFMSWWHPPIIGTMEYRAPETLLQAGWSCPVDNFASGCVLAELISGEYLLPGLREEDHLKAIETAMEMPIPQNLLNLGRKNLNQYNQRLIVKRQGGNNWSIPEVVLQHPVKRLRNVVKDPELLDLCKGLLAIDPALRLEAGAAKGSAFFKRSTFDVTKVDETFCLQARVPDENETDMVESSDTADASKESTQVPSIPVGGFPEYTFVDNEVEDEDVQDIIESNSFDEIQAEGAVEQPPPRNPPPPAPKALPRIPDSPAKKSEILQKENVRATRAAPPPSPGQMAPPLRDPPVPPPRAGLSDPNAPPNAKPPKPPMRESVHAAKAITPSKAPQLLSKGTDSSKKQQNATSPAHNNHLVSPLLVPNEATSQNQRFHPPISAEKLKNPYVSPMMQAMDAAADSAGVHSPYTQIPTPSRQVAQRSAGPPPPRKIDSPQQPTNMFIPELQHETPGRQQGLQANGALNFDSSPQSDTSPGSRPAGFISGILSNLTTAVKTTISSPDLAVASENLPSPMIKPHDENTHLNSRQLEGMSPATHKPQSSNLSSKKNPVDGGEEISWEYDLSDRLAKLHERLTRLRHENSAWAEGKRDRIASHRERTAEIDRYTPPASLESSPMKVPTV